MSIRSCIRHDNRIHGIIFRLQTDVIGLAIEGLDRRGVVDQRNHHVAIGSGLTLLHKNGVAVKDARIDHGLAFNL